MSSAAADWPRIIVHADMDAFYAAIEQLDDPALRNRPVLVGPNSNRGVVLTASYEARPYRVGSAMPMARARVRCPDAVIVPPRFDRYRSVSAAIMQVFEDFSPDVEALSLDEAFLDMTGSTHLFGSIEQIGRSIKVAVREATGGLTASVGISSSKFVAKVASAHRKPDGLTIVPPLQVLEWLAPQPVSVLWGAGPKTQRRLHELGYETVGQVAGASRVALERTLGRAGTKFHALANGRDPRSVERRDGARSLSSERTLAHDLSDPERILRHLRKAADTVAARLRRAQLHARGVRVKLKRSDFRLLSRQRKLAAGTDSADDLYSTAAAIAEPILGRGPFRLIGVGAFDLSRAQRQTQYDLLDGTDSRSRKLDRVVDQARARFGDGAVKRARELGSETVLDESPNLDFLYRNDH